VPNLLFFFKKQLIKLKLIN